MLESTGQIKPTNLSFDELRRLSISTAIKPFPLSTLVKIAQAENKRQLNKILKEALKQC